MLFKKFFEKMKKSLKKKNKVFSDWKATEGWEGWRERDTPGPLPRSEACLRLGWWGKPSLQGISYFWTFSR